MESSKKKESIAIALVCLTATVSYMLLLANHYGSIGELTWMETAWPSFPYLVLVALVVSTMDGAVRRQKRLLKVAIIMAVVGGVVFLLLVQDSGAMRVAPFLPLLVIPVVQLLVLVGGVIMLPSNREVEEEKLPARELSATLVSEEDGGKVRYSGLLKEEGGRYRLIIEANRNGDIHVVADVVKEALDEMAAYLRAETKFIMEDFKQ